MIDKVVADGFKGLEIYADLERLNLVIGPMGCGKTAISDAIELVATGRISGAGKTNQAIMDAFATKDKMLVGVRVENKNFERRFIRSKKGTVTQKFRAGNAFVTKEEFTTAFAVTGRPTIFNLDAFMGLSDEKKINKLFELYPPEGDVFSIHDKINEATEEINMLNSEITKTEGIIQKLTVDQAKIELPQGTLAEVKQDLDANEAEITLCRKNLNKQLRIEADEAEAKKAEEERQIESQVPPSPAPGTRLKGPAPRSQLGGPVTHTARNTEDFNKPKNIDQMVEEVEQTIKPDPEIEYGSKEHARAMVTQTDKTDAAALIQGIIDTMDEAGCTICAAKLVAKQSLNKIRG